jgi:hypothetical protein
VRLQGPALEDYVARVAELMERLGAVLDPGEDLWVRESPDGARWFELLADLGGGASPDATIVVRERWRAARAGALERSEYEYALLDRERDVCRAFHLHDAEWFIDRHQVVAHEHCEHPIGVAPCPHLEGSPVRDAFAGVMRLIGVWTDPGVPDCRALPCLERSA